eukprot:COSAG01_NODE_50576_length_362_cov_0.771863_1_plen_61_part_10
MIEEEKNWLRFPYVFMLHRCQYQNPPPQPSSAHVCARCWLPRSDEEELGALEGQWQAGEHT